MHVSVHFSRVLCLLWSNDVSSNLNFDVDGYPRDVLYVPDPPELLIHRGNLVEDAILQSLLGMLTGKIKKKSNGDLARCLEF